VTPSPSSAAVAYSNLVALLVAVIFGIFALSEPLPRTAYAPPPSPPARPTRAGLTPRGGGAGGSEGLAGRGLSLLGMVLGSVALSGAGAAPPAPPGKAAGAATRKLPIAQYEMSALEVAHPRPRCALPPCPRACACARCAPPPPFPVLTGQVSSLPSY
jgi:hypothetical protein